MTNIVNIYKSHLVYKRSQMVLLTEQESLTSVSWLRCSLPLHTTKRPRVSNLGASVRQLHP